MAAERTRDSSETTDIHEVDAELAEGTTRFDFEPNFDARLAVVTIETVEGEVSASFDRDLQNLSEYRNVNLYVADASAMLKRFTVSVTAHVKSRVKIVVAFLRGQVKTAAAELPCRVCKKLTKTLIAAVLAYVGVPYLDPEAGPIKISDEQRKLIEEIIFGQSSGSIGKLIESIDISIWQAIQSVFSALGWVLDAPGKLSGLTCQTLRLCPAVISEPKPAT